MTFDWNEYLPVAKHLANAQQSGIHPTQREEAFYRIAASRAYYAVYNQVYGWAFKEYPSIPMDAGKAHTTIPEHLLRETNENRQALGRSLQSLGVKRRIADYKANQMVNKRDAEAAIIFAEEVLGCLSKV